MKLTPGEREYILYRLNRAREALDEAELLLDAEHLATAVSRIYYACFYAVSALLLTEGRSSTKHSGVRALFDRHWVKPGRISKDLGRFYRDMFERRQESDYVDLVSYKPEEVSGWLEQARTFVEEISRHAEKALKEAEDCCGGHGRPSRGGGPGRGWGQGLPDGSRGPGDVLDDLR